MALKRILALTARSLKQPSRTVLNEQRERMVYGVFECSEFWVPVSPTPSGLRTLSQQNITPDNPDYKLECVAASRYMAYKKVTVPKALQDALVRYIYDDSIVELASDTPVEVIPTLDADNVSKYDSLSCENKGFEELMFSVLDTLGKHGAYESGDDVEAVPIFSPTGYNDSKLPFFHIDLQQHAIDEGGTFYVMNVTGEPQHGTEIINQPVYVPDITMAGVSYRIAKHLPKAVTENEYVVNELAIAITKHLFMHRDAAISEAVSRGDFETEHVPTNALIKMNKTLHRSPAIVREGVPRFVLGVFVGRNQDMAP